MDFQHATSPPSKRRGKSDTFQSELRAKMRERNSRGLATDVTASEDEGSDDDIDGLLTQFNQTSRVKPAKPDPSGKGYIKEQQPWRPPTLKNKQEAPSGRKTPTIDGQSPMQNGRKSPYMGMSNDQPIGRKSPQPGPSLSDTIFGRQSPKQPGKQPSRGHHEDDEEDEDLLAAYNKSQKGTKAPWQPSSKQKAGELSKEKLIFGSKTPPAEPREGRKTPNNDRDSPSSFRKSSLRRQSPLDSHYEDDDEKHRPGTDVIERKPWKPPNVRQQEEEEKERARVSTGRWTPTRVSGGRKTPTDFDPIGEALKAHPHPNPRRKGTSEPGESPRSDDGTPKPRPRIQKHSSKESDDLDKRKTPPPRRRPPSDIFGSKRPSLGEEDDDKTPKRGSTPVGKTGRKSPAPPGGRQTPKTGSRSSTPSGEKDTRKKSNASLLDMLGGGQPKAKPRRQSLLDNSGSEDELDGKRLQHSQKRSPHPQARRRARQGSNSEEDYQDERETRRQSLREKQEALTPGAPPADRPRERESSLCREYDRDPAKDEQEMKDREKERLTRQKTSKQRRSVAVLEEMIDTVADAQGGREKTMQFIEPDKNSRDKSPRDKKGTPTARPRARYSIAPTTPDPDSRPGSRFEDTVSIRQSVYEEWYQERMKSARKAKKEKEKREKEIEEKKQKEIEDKRLESMATFKSWSETKKEADKEKLKKLAEDKRKVKEKEDEEAEKIKNSELAFRSWKQDKDCKLKEVNKNKNKEEQDKTKATKDLKAMKTKEADGAFRGWKTKKDVSIKQNIRQQRKENKSTEKDLLETQKLKEKEADERYDSWIEVKEKQQKLDRKRRRQKKHEDIYNPKPAWSPNQPTVPFGK